MASLQAHYDELASRDRYEDVDVALGALPPAEVRRRFVVGEDARAFATETGTDGVCTIGVSVTGPPHAGTLGQMQTAIALQRAGFDVQLVVADMEPYSTGGYSLDVVTERARRFVEFVDALGFDHDRGRLRTQHDAADVMQTAYRLSRYADPERDMASFDLEDTAWEVALRDAYDADGVDASALDESDLPVDWTPSEFTRRMDGLLVVADMLHPLLVEDYPANCIVMGADERGLRPMIEGVRERCRTDGTLHALYTRLVPGLDGYPKLSRRIPDSRLTLAADPARIRATVAGETDDPAASDRVVREMMRMASSEDASTVDRWQRACETDPDAWADARATFAEELAAHARTWQATATGD